MDRVGWIGSPFESDSQHFALTFYFGKGVESFAVLEYIDRFLARVHWTSTVNLEYVTSCCVLAFDDCNRDFGYCILKHNITAFEQLSANLNVTKGLV